MEGAVCGHDIIETAPRYGLIFHDRFQIHGLPCTRQEVVAVDDEGRVEHQPVILVVSELRVREEREVLR